MVESVTPVTTAAPPRLSGVAGGRAPARPPPEPGALTGYGQVVACGELHRAALRARVSRPPHSADRVFRPRISPRGHRASGLVQTRSRSRVPTARPHSACA